MHMGAQFFLFFFFGTLEIFHSKTCGAQWFATWCTLQTRR
jgi:hypothetical protein